MSWLKKVENVQVNQELEYENSGIAVTNAYTAEITEAYLKDSSDAQSKSKSLVVGVKTEDGDTARTYFTVMGRDGETFYKKVINGNEIKVQHMGLSLVNSLFGIVLNKDIFDCEPKDVQYQEYNKDTKERETVTGDGFPELLGKKVGICAQMIRKIAGADSKEYCEIQHFFDCETGLFNKEERTDKPTKLDKWIKSAKDYKVIEEAERSKSAFGAKQATKQASEDAPFENAAAPKSKWGR